MYYAQATLKAGTMIIFRKVSLKQDGSASCPVDVFLGITSDNRVAYLTYNPYAERMSLEFARLDYDGRLICEMIIQ